MSKARGLADLGNVYNDGALSNRNLIINGAMQVAQRGVNFIGKTISGYFLCDRWELGLTALGTWTVSQESDGPSGFANSFKLACTTANASPAAGAFLFLNYKIEGQDLQQLAKGTADASPMVLSFWVKSNKIGTYQVSLIDNDNTRMVAGTYTVDTSATWEYKTIAVPADTIGAFDNDANGSLNLEFWLDSGVNFTGGAVPTAWETQANIDRNEGSNVNLADTTGNYFQITGVQLEVGDTATPFEHRSYGQELALCQRYYTKLGPSGAYPRFGAGLNISTVTNSSFVTLPTTMRAVGTLAGGGVFGVYAGSGSVFGSSSQAIDTGGSSLNTVTIEATTSGLTVGGVGYLIGNNDATSFISMDAEL